MNQPNYPYVQGPAPVMMPHNSSMAVVSLVSGIAGWTILPFLGAIVAIITGHMAKNEIKRGGGMITGDGMATWGLVLGYINVALGLCIVCLLILSFAGLITIPFFNYNSY